MTVADLLEMFTGQAFVVVHDEDDEVLFYGDVDEALAMTGICGASINGVNDLVVTAFGIVAGDLHIYVDSGVAA